MKLIGWLLLATLLQSCGLNDSLNAKKESLNESALYDPPTITLLPDVKYTFVEGSLVGRDQKFHSDWSYRRAIIVGNSNK
jgi:hypothetical protein